MTYAALGNDVVGELLHFRAGASEQRDLEAVLGVEVHVQCRLRQIVPVMEVAS
jgi:hypothetical protein